MKIFKPNKIIGFLLFNFSFFLLIYVFYYHLEDSAIAYLAYLLSTYGLILLVLWLRKFGRNLNNHLKRSKLYQTYQTNHTLFLKSTILLSLLLNSIYCLFNFFVGIYYHSFWFLTFAVYYFLLSMMRFMIFYNIKELGQNIQKECRKLKICGILLLILNIVLAGIIILVIHEEVKIEYSGFIIYIVAFYDFYLTISAIINIIKERRSTNPILFANKAIKVIVALVSMISLEVAMLTTFDHGNTSFKVMMTSSLGGAVCLINTFIAIALIRKSYKYKEKKLTNK